jgi:predicted phosphodiesterase
MRIGIIADIHEDVEALQQAIDLLRGEKVDRLLVLGDLFYAGQRVAETVDALAAAGVVGVWGNHDLGLCYEPAPYLVARHPIRVFEFLKSLSARLEIEDCLFTHGLPQWDPFDPAEYYLGDRPESATGLAGSFAASSRRVTFVGHFHRWLSATPEGIIPWNGNEMLTLERERRFLVVVGAVCDGWCASYDTANGVLIPHRVREICRSS